MIVNGFCMTSSSTLKSFDYGPLTVYPKISKNTIVVGVDYLFILRKNKKVAKQVEKCFVIDTSFHLQRCGIHIADATYVPPGRYTRSTINLAKNKLSIADSFSKELYIRNAKRILKKQ